MELLKSRFPTPGAFLSCTCPNSYLTQMCVRWAALRAFEGWAALQHHALLHTRITVFPSSLSSAQAAVDRDPVRLLVDIQQGSFFTIFPSQDEDSKDSTSRTVYTPRWWAGNIYETNVSPPHAVPLPSAPSKTSPTTYDLFVSGDYEVCLRTCLYLSQAESVQIRLFGDPKVSGTSVPTLTVKINIDVDHSDAPLNLSPDHDLVPDFVDGWAFGGALGVGLHSSKGWWTITGVAPSDSLVYEVRLLFASIDNFLTFARGSMLSSQERQ